MGQAWCKEKSNKAQDSKSPLDRVFLRCAHRIYPGLKEEGSVLGGATQRVTSSEIGYASSPSREVLTRGQSIDSVDRPFHPSDWVDVNLEVPVTPRTSTTMTSPILDTTVYQPPSYASANFTGSRDFVPVPPPRRKKKNRGRPLPPKPDDVARSDVERASKNSTSLQKGHEPFYSSVKLSKNWSNEKEIFEHRINGTGRVIPSVVVAASRSNREKSSRESERIVEMRDSRRKNSSTISLPNYSELDVVKDESLGDDDQDETRIRKITAAGSLPALITGGAPEDLRRNDDRKREGRTTTETEVVDGGDIKCPTDEVDFSIDPTRRRENQNLILKFEAPRLASTPVKIGLENDSSTAGGWFLHQDRSPGLDLFSAIETSDARKSLFHDRRTDSRGEIFFEAEENRLYQSNDNRDGDDEKVENEVGRRARTRPKRSLSNESEPFDTRDEKDLEGGEIDTTILRSNTGVKLLARTISEESLPREMLENEVTDFFEDKAPIPEYERRESTNDGNGEAVRVESTVEGDSKTPPPSPEPRITPEILENDHSSRLKVVLRDEDSNLSSMTPSLTELEAALSDMLEREDDPILHEDTSDKIQVESSTKKMSTEIPVSLTNILGSKENSPRAESSFVRHLDDPLPLTDVDLTNGEKNACPSGVPPEKPSRLSQTSREEASVNSTNVPTPPRRRNRYSGYIPSILDTRSLERTATPENSHPNDRLI